MNTFMKPILTILIFCISISLFSQKISGKVTYKFSAEPLNEKKFDSAYTARTKKKMDTWMKGIFKNTKDVHTFLTFANGESLYVVEDKMQNDGKTIFNLNRTYAGGDNIYYKNTNTKEYFFQNDTGELLLTDLAPIKWKITQETKKIGKYLCYKAIDIESKNKKMKPIAWFTPLIPVSFGPKEYNGLPGLVLLVEMSKRSITAIKIVLNPSEDIVIEKPTKGKKETVEEYKKRVASFMKFLQKKS